MPEQPPPPPVGHPPSLEFCAPGGDDTVACERCRARMFRVRSVWHCPGCGRTTDGYGW